MTIILSRFRVRKSTPSFVTHLILKLVSTKDNESILAKEQKLMTHLGIELMGKKGSGQTVKAGLVNHKRLRVCIMGVGSSERFHPGPMDRCIFLLSPLPVTHHLVGRHSIPRCGRL